jgi:exodeoxyribonuclease V alpha subunit
MMAGTNGSSSSVRGRVEAIFYATPQFSAGRLRTLDGDSVPFAGSLMVRQHDAVVLQGAWERHPKFGRQFKVAHFAFDQAMGPEGLAHYLANHPDIKGIGPVKARRIVEAFGDDFDRIIDEEPERIAAVAKVPLEAVQALRTEWLRTRTLNASLTWLASFELTHHQMTALIEKFGNAVVTVLKTDPYLLVREVPGFGFKRVDVVARKMGTPKEHPSRIRAGIVHCVAERLDQGDCWVDYEDLIELANALLVMDIADSRKRIEQALDALIDEGVLACPSISGRFLVAQPKMHQMERDLAEIFAARRRPNPHFTDDIEEAVAGAFPELNEAQRRALLAAARHNLVLVSGGAGSGKTFSVAAITRLYERQGLKVILAAPTGKAAKRMEQVVGREAFTLHRLLGFNGKTFQRGPDDLIEADVIIVDEVSMVDVPLAWHFLQAIDLGRTCVVLVGDHNQLPPVGPGNLLRDLIERQPIPTVVLDQVVRQAGVLKENSIAVLSGEVRRTAGEAKDGRPPWIVVNRLSDVLDAQRYVLELFESVLVERLRFDLLADVQLLTPTRKGPLGVDALNIELQRLIQKKLWGVEVESPRPGRRPEFLVHDRIIQTRNNYDLGVMNGAIGIVTSMGPRRGELSVHFDDQEVEYTPENGGAKDLSLAYALTVHKCQGSEFPCAVLVIHKAHSFMHHRNLFYTGVTRARQVAIVIGDQWGMRNCAEKEQVERRKTFLSVLDLPAPEARRTGPW